MSSFTPKEIRGLYSAYAEVHMTEEDHFASSLLEEINAVINHMVDEGWDLSEYTLEELQESFLDVVILPEIERFNEVVSQLNESTGELTEEQHEEFILEWGWALNLLGKGKKAQQAVKTTTSATSAVSRPSVLQAPLVGSKPAASTAPISAPAKPLNVTKPLPSGLSVTGGPQKGGIVTGISNWFKGLSKAKPAAPATTPTPTPAAATPKPVAPKSTAPKPVGTRTSDVVWSKLKSGWGRLTAPGRQAGPLNTPGGVKDRLFGTTRRGLATRLGVLGDVAGTIADPTKPSPTVAIGGGLTALTGLAMQGLAGAERFGTKDGQQRTSVGTSLKKGGEALTDIGVKGMTQPWRRGRSGRIDQKTGLPVYNSYEMEGEEELSESLAYDSKTETWYDIDDKGNKVQVSPTQDAIDRYNELLKKKREAEAKAKPAKPAEPEPAKPEPAKGGMSAADLKAAQDAANKARQQGKLSNIPAVPPAEPAKPKPVPPAAPAPKPEKKYQFTVGDKSFDLTKAQINQTYRDPKALGGINAVDFGRAANQAIYQFKKPGPSNLMKRYTQPSVEKVQDAYDVVLDYLLSEGHADTVEEAHYVMMQLDTEYIQSIVESGYFPTPESQRADEAKYKDKLSTGELPGRHKPVKGKPPTKK